MKQVPKAAPVKENKPLDDAAVLAKIEAIEKTVGSIKGRIGDLEAKKKSLADEEEAVLLMVDSELNMGIESQRHHKKSHKDNKKKVKKAKKKKGKKKPKKDKKKKNKKKKTTPMPD